MTAAASFLGRGERDRILLATAELCAELGYEELDVGRIAGRAGVGEERFHELFPDKDAAAQAAIDAILGGVVSLVGELYQPDRSEVESAVEAIAAILRLMAENPQFASLSYVASRQMMPPHLKRGLDSGSQLLAAMLDRFRDYSTAKGQPIRAARAALGGAEAVVRREIARGRTSRLPELIPDLIYAATVPFFGQQEALRLAKTLGRAERS